MQQFPESFNGDVIGPSDARYGDARRVWNAMIDRRPALIVRPVDAEDVATAIRFGRENDLLIAVRGGGHSMPGYGTCDDGLVIDLSSLRGVSVDAAGCSARVRGGSLLGELDTAAQAHGLVCPVGVVSHTGVGGLTLGGGMGRLQRKHGFTIDNVRAVEIVTADGSLVRASAEENPDLFWAVRGAGANFGVVTEFEFQLHPFDGTITVCRLSHPASRMRDLWSLWSDFAASAPDHIMLAFGIGLGVAGSGLPEELVGQPIVTLGAYHSGDQSRASDDLKPLLDFGPPASITFTPMSYLDLQRSADVELGWGRRTYTKGGFTDHLPGVALDALVDLAARAADGGSFGLWAQGGAIARVDEDAMAFTGRQARFQMSVETTWDEPAQDDAQREWAKAVYAVVEPYSYAGRYVNDVTDSGPDMARWIYGDAKYEKLVAVKRAWDPDNTFRYNFNIKP
jgi:FAD/FMN-containing dehydrogenase